MRAPLTHPSYTDIQRGCSIIAKKILTSGLPYSMIVALSRGGLIPGVELSHFLDLPLTPVCYSAKSGHGDNRNHLNNLPALTSGPGRILLVDDIADSGHTMNEVQDHYEIDHIVDTAVLYWKGGSVHAPTYWWQTIYSDSPWIIFPWEAG